MKLGFLLTATLLAGVSCTKNAPADTAVEAQVGAGETVEAADMVPVGLEDVSPVASAAAISPADAPSPVTP